MRKKLLTVLVLVIFFGGGIFLACSFLPYKKTVCSVENSGFKQTKDKCEKTGGFIGTNQHLIDLSEKMARITIDPALVKNIEEFSSKISDQVRKSGYDSGLTVVDGKETFQVMAPKFIADYLKSRNPEIKDIVYDKPIELKVTFCSCPDGLVWDCDRGCIKMNKNICLYGDGKWVDKQCRCDGNAVFDNFIGKCFDMGGM